MCRNDLCPSVRSNLTYLSLLVRAKAAIKVVAMTTRYARMFGDDETVRVLQSVARKWHRFAQPDPCRPDNIQIGSENILNEDKPFE